MTVTSWIKKRVYISEINYIQNETEIRVVVLQKYANLLGSYCISSSLLKCIICLFFKIVLLEYLNVHFLKLIETNSGERRRRCPVKVFGAGSKIHSKSSDFTKLACMVHQGILQGFTDLDAWILNPFQMLL